MSNYRWRSMNEDLAEGATDGRYKKIMPNTCSDAAPGNKAATIKARASLNALNGFDWSKSRNETKGDGTAAEYDS